jgi:hypothetical protein
MADLFLHPKVLDYQGDKYQLIQLTMRWARTLKSRGTAEPIQSLIEKALLDLVENRITPEEILAVPAPVEQPKEETVDVAALVEDIPRTLPPDDEEDTDKKKAAKKKKKEE